MRIGSNSDEAEPDRHLKTAQARQFRRKAIPGPACEAACSGSGFIQNRLPIACHSFARSALHDAEVSTRRAVRPLQHNSQRAERCCGQNDRRPWFPPTGLRRLGRFIYRWLKNTICRVCASRNYGKYALKLNVYSPRELPLATASKSPCKILLGAGAAILAECDATIKRAARPLHGPSTAPNWNRETLFLRTIFASLIADGDLHLEKPRPAEGRATRHQPVRCSADGSGL
jgi:hypothetical protein